ncbi:GUN4 domain-containing protein [Pseudanabaena galeata UHCC 0370]|uniref:GUN4 domain-containing protein n=1 Tax=Pseudanabaena galeata UHCC 0370 TaxID=3110310 RepID=A0ABU5TJB9_9CYAN|nr:GUN4 domain-containing protein [Pseudanabaena galeata]MEA5478376.1 GUN4 domain-containing protein [Pseudanabaena galeata UHCC 0370]
MARNCAVIVGINDYDEISPLKYAKSDAEKMRDFFMRDLGVSHDELYFFTDDSPRNVQGRKTQPTYGTLKSFLGDRFENSFLSAGDTLWFYFSGHGMPCEGRDYLLPSDGNPRSIPDLAIPIGFVTERLRRSGADNVVMLIDACRSDGAKNAGMGIGEEKQQGVITFFSCSPSQVSYEIDEIGQGAFTNVLLEALRIQGEGNCATVERFYQYLRTQVPRLTQRYKNYLQTPYAAIEPPTKYHYILLPKFANLTDITALKNDALKAEISGNIELAEQIWKRVSVASSGNDSEVFDAFKRLANKQSAPLPQPREAASSSGSKTPLSPQVSPPAVPKEFQREVIGRKTPPAPEAKKNPVELLSAKGIDYSELDKLLKNKQWFEADILTDKLMLKISGREKEGWLYLESIKKFPCKDLLTIDRLWVNSSNGLYGFSVQKDIYVECGGKLNFSSPSDETWKKFCDRTSWTNESKLVDYPQAFFERNFMNVKGHLPKYKIILKWWEPGYMVGGSEAKVFSFLVSRLVKCNP